MPLTKLSTERLEGVDEKMTECFTRAALNFESKYPHYNIQVADKGGFRTKDEQADLYSQGRTKPGKVITDSNGVDSVSKHQLGLAIDVVIKDKNKNPIWDKEWFEEFSDIFKNEATLMEIPLIWGGDWNKPDRPHFQTRKIK